jgi:hypothetical protein
MMQIFRPNVQVTMVSLPQLFRTLASLPQLKAKVQLNSSIPIGAKVEISPKG